MKVEVDELEAFVTVRERRKDIVRIRWWIQQIEDWDLFICSASELPARILNYSSPMLSLLMVPASRLPLNWLPVVLETASMRSCGY